MLPERPFPPSSPATKRLSMSIRSCFSVVLSVHCLLGVLTDASAQRGWAQEIDFNQEIQPLLARRCYACHGPDQQEGGFRMDDRDSLLREADTGEVPIVPGEPERSEMIRRVRSAEEWERMPPEGEPLKPEEIALLEKWIAGGAEFAPHWAFQPIRQPPAPQVVNEAWATNAIDRFILARLEEKGLVPNPVAPPEVLVRRVFLDITGLPPSPEELQDWTRDWSDEKYERLVDSLLSSAAFGEHWSRMWLDVVRYAETNSFERDGVKPNAWKYRDYVIRSFNQDKPYDRFLQEQLAGDELDDITADSLTATGFYRLGTWDDEPADPLQAEFDGYDDIVTTISQAMLGLTLNCARCHDHKIDPLTQRDYYSMLACVRDVTPYGTRSDQRTNNQVDLNPDVARQHERLEKRRKHLQRRMHQIEQEAIVKMPAPDQRATEGPERQQVLDAKLRLYTDEATFAEYNQLKVQLAEVIAEQQSLPPRETVLGLGVVDKVPKPTYVLLRGSPHAPGEEVQPAFPELLGGGSPVVPPADAPPRSSGRRRALAEWITDDANWMTPRVIVNRLWLHYFGRGIVRSPNNFGLMGDPPTHPQLIDYLATELLRGDWHLKRIHRMILLSTTYRMASDYRAEAAEVDPQNNLFWRQNLRRLSAEQIRDGVLKITGQLNRQVGGPSMYPLLSAEVLASQSRPGSGWGNSSPAEQARRSVYIHVKRSLPIPLLQAFDFPETDISCEARFLTTQPGQALTMLNSQWMQQQAAALQQRVRREVGPELRAQAQRCLELVTGLPADPTDVEELVSLVIRLREKHHLNVEEARRAMCLVALNLNSFLYVD
ncbi:MAG: hypothetical protein KatS3mg111_4156 [Pirellulaceae bacterium]|nr:MAG: hypothetical protein KatS3mg111_4156 [Pirellulaceae bacterium]